MITIPGPKGPPLVRQAGALRAGPPQYLSRLADEYGPFVRFGLFNLDIYLVTDPDLIREVLVTQAANFPKGERDVNLLTRLAGVGLVTANGAVHQRQRRLAQPAFHSKRINAYAETMVDYTEAMLDEWRDGQALDAAEAMRDLTLYIVSRTLFAADRELLRESTERIGRAIDSVQTIANKEFQAPFVYPVWLPTPMNRERRAARDEIYGIVDRLIAQRRAAGDVDGGDLLSMLLLSRDESGDGFSDDEVRDQLVTLFIAGHETTSNALTWTWYLLSQHPQVEAALHAEVDSVLGGRAPTLADLPQLPYTLRVIKEAMRLYPPAWLLNARQAAADTTIGPYPIKRGDLLWISPYAMHRRPQYFPDPERFDPDRWTPEREKALPRYAYLPFGGGPRVCIGNNFAQMEAHLVTAAVARRFRLRLQPGHVIDLNAQITLSNRGGMPMRLERRDGHPSAGITDGPQTAQSASAD